MCVNRNGGAFGVRRLGAALVVVSKFHGFPRQETRWAHYRMIAAVLKWTTKAAPSRRTPKAVAISILRNNWRLAPNLTSLAFRRYSIHHLPKPQSLVSFSLLTQVENAVMSCLLAVPLFLFVKIRVHSWLKFFFLNSILLADSGEF